MNGSALLSNLSLISDSVLYGIFSAPFIRMSRSEVLQKLPLTREP